MSVFLHKQRPGGQFTHALVRWAIYTVCTVDNVCKADIVCTVDSACKAVIVCTVENVCKAVIVCTVDNANAMYGRQCQ